MNEIIKNRKGLGYFGENIASRYLEQKGYKIVAKNYQKPWGEIDLIAEKEELIVFCEVKTNSKSFSGYFNPELRVNKEKAKHIIRTAKIFINKHYPGRGWRIDIVAVTINDLDKSAKVVHFKNAIVDPYT